MRHHDNEQRLLSPTASLSKKSTMGRYPACDPTVLSCKQQTIALSKVHEVSNTNVKRDINTAVLPLVATEHPRP